MAIQQQHELAALQQGGHLRQSSSPSRPACKRSSCSAPPGCAAAQATALQQPGEARGPPRSGGSREQLVYCIIN
jgi:hypothetical protein